MKTKKEILQELLSGAEETLIRIEITEKYLQQLYAQDNKQNILEELAKLTANKKENENWRNFLKSQAEA